MKVQDAPSLQAIANERDVAVIPGPEPGTGLRVRVEPGHDGYVRLEQLAFNANVGWYTQKSFCIPASMLAQVVPALRKADCLLPRSRPNPEVTSLVLRPAMPAEVDQAAGSGRRSS